MEHTLKNPVWHSLCETHATYSLDYEGVKFYDPEICTFGAFTDSSKTLEVLNEYATQVDSFFLVSENETPTFDKNVVVLDKKIEGCQMVLAQFNKATIIEEIVHLTEEHLDEIYDLIWLVMPGYYQKRTFEMGSYVGIFKEGKLVSIAGQRLQTDDWIEVSAIVTHPEHTRKGYAKQLTSYITEEILKANKHPILHTNKGNSAIGLYEKLGYTLTRDMNWWYFRKK